ncbi:hypothetical protein KAFR_0F00130 [Kazachstania africana CBS 2517]|uniref:Uncharacterized protein n=1 Tax=Kazachstania africana (strain ATCC 22294 / BCRC 22015 / CBS 2517 / CECT 1963 / NBRC 1671 / NRRL Y-8276) TaxID=1071382 RepID=H2AW60_KAZAF|nr:hypothetical protein KAFR_0F00130 [Kazachstania africana CBS 2517]CCF58610.1 hypothetical protein KAFR_0F00130 [Kazachstania africana CBS 2517]
MESHKLQNDSNNDTISKGGKHSDNTDFLVSFYLRIYSILSTQAFFLLTTEYLIYRWKPALTFTIQYHWPYIVNVTIAYAYIFRINTPVRNTGCEEETTIDRLLLTKKSSLWLNYFNRVGQFAFFFFTLLAHICHFGWISSRYENFNAQFKSLTISLILELGVAGIMCHEHRQDTLFASKLIITALCTVITSNVVLFILLSHGRCSLLITKIWSTATIIMYRALISTTVSQKLPPGRYHTVIPMLFIMIPIQSFGTMFVRE